MENENLQDPASPPHNWSVTDPYNVTNTSRTQDELEEFLIFGIMVAGKNAKVTEGALSRFYSRLRIDLARDEGEDSPFDLIGLYIDCGGDLSSALREAGIGCYTVKSESLKDVLDSGIVPRLATIPLEELMEIHGIGPKTARFFILHSRKDARVACLDTHIMKFLKLAYPQYNIPKSTPAEPRYAFFEGLWLNVCDILGVDSATLDLLVWTHKGDYRAVREDLAEKRAVTEALTDAYSDRT